MRLALLLAALIALCAPVSQALAGPDRVTGGVTVPDGRLTGGGADGGDPVEPAAEAAVATQATGAPAAPPARIAQAGTDPDGEATPGQPDDEDVDVGVPVPEQAPDQTAAVTPQATGGFGELARTGFAAAALAAAGAICAAAGLGLRRMLRC